MKTLHFFPHYEPYLRDGSKTLTLRLANRQGLRSGDRVSICVGWEPDQRHSLFPAYIDQVRRLPLCELTEIDLRNESPDCRSVESASLVMSAVYRRLIDPTEFVYAIHFHAVG